MISTKQRHIVIAGPTGSGKSALALKLAKHLNAEIVNCDSVQCYRGLDIGSAKPTQEERGVVPHHLFDVVEPTENYDAGSYAKDARAAIDDIEGRGKVAIIVGGSGLYLRALMGEHFHEDLPSDEGLRAKLARKSSEVIRRLLVRLDPKRASQLHPNDRYRNERALELRVIRKQPMPQIDHQKPSRSFDPYIIYLDPDREVLRKRIRSRTEFMFAQGLLAEVSELLKAGVPTDAKAMQSIGYHEATLCLESKLSLEQAKDAVFFASCQYAKRQRTWFKKLEHDLRIDDPNNWKSVETALISWGFC